MIDYHKKKGIEYNPLQQLTLPYVDEDCNLVVLAPTSSGKTIVAEQFMLPTLDGGEKVLYLSPLKALTSEKLHAWADVPYSRVAFTSDHARPGVTVDERLILMTTECLDSKTRGGRRWLKSIGTLVSDESHMLAMYGRGDAFEIGLTRFTQINPSARIIFLSATIPNADELGHWLSQLNGKPSKVIKTEWRPIVQEHHFISAPDTNWDFLRKAKETASMIASRHYQDQILIFVHSIGTGKNLAKFLDCPFHYSKVTKQKRAAYEEAFRDKRMRVMVSTSTLAYGVNLPADVGLIVGGHRGPTLVDPADIKQEAGRIGRYGLSDKGIVYYLFMNWYFKQMREDVMNVPEVKSVLPDRIYFHLVSFIAREKMGIREIERFLGRTLAAHQAPIGKAMLEAIDLLSSYGIVKQNGDVLSVSPIGRAAALMYVDPIDLYFLRKNLQSKPYTPTRLARALTDIPSLRYDTYIPKDMTDVVKMPYGAQTLLATGLYYWLSGKPITDVVSTLVFSYIADVERWMAALRITGMNKHYCETLELMLKSGVSSKVIELVKIPGIGRKRAENLYKLGIRSPEDILKNEKVARNVLGKATFEKVKHHIEDKGKLVIRF